MTSLKKYMAKVRIENMKKSTFVFIFCGGMLLGAAAIATAILLIRAHNTNVYNHYLGICTQCVEKRGDEIKELFDIYENHGVVWVERGIDSAKRDNEVVLESNGFYYHIGTTGEADDASTEAYKRLCKIYDDLYANEPISSIEYRKEAAHYLEIYFSDDVEDVDYSLIYSNSVPQDVYKREVHVKIKDGYYFTRYHLNRL